MEPQSSARARVTPKDFFLWVGALAALYLSVVSFVFLLFNYIDFAFSNALAYRPDPYQGGMPYEMASLLVLVPVYLALAFLIRCAIARDASRKNVWVRRWAIILTLFIASLTAVADTITLLTAFFRGEELTSAFLLKIAIVLVLALVGFLYFIGDLCGYFDTRARAERAGGGILVAVALIAIIAGFFIIGTPRDARLARFDAERISNLESIEWQVVSYWQNKRTIPAALDALDDPLGGFTTPLDPQTGAAYGYSKTGALSFELCARFARASDDTPRPRRAALPTGFGKGTTDSWSHAAGLACFSRSIDPERYPPAQKTTL